MALKQVYTDSGVKKSRPIAGSGASKAENTAYDNTESELSATNAQDAIDELKMLINYISAEANIDISGAYED